MFFAGAPVRVIQWLTWIPTSFNGAKSIGFNHQTWFAPLPEARLVPGDELRLRLNSSAYANLANADAAQLKQTELDVPFLMFSPVKSEDFEIQT